MTKSSKMRYVYQWKTCRNTPFLARKEIVESLSKYFESVYDKLGEMEIESWDTPKPNEIEVTISTGDTHKAPNQIFWVISRSTASYLGKKHPDLRKLPNIWTRDYKVRTKG